MMKLFDRVSIGDVKLRNRIAMAPMGTKTAVDGGFEERSIEYYRRRAAGGCGLIITGLNMCSTKYETRAANTLTGFHQVDRLALLVQQCHAEGAKVLVQIGPGLGRVAYSDPSNPPHSASAVPCKNYPDVMCKPFTKEEIADLVKSMGFTASLAKNAGADGVEIHAYGGYILDQFLTKKWNKRTDEYGGSIENRSRFLMECVQEVKKVCGKGFACVVKITVDHCMPEDPEMRTIEEGIELAKTLNNIEGIDAIHVDTGCYERYYMQVSTVYQKPGYAMYAQKAVKEVIDIPLIGHGKFNDPEVAEKAVETGCVDVVAIGHQMCADEEWANKVKEGRFRDIQYCCGCNECLLGAVRGRIKTCAINPISNVEIDYPLTPIERDTNLLVIGGGAAGMEAAITAAKRGIKVELWEKSEKLGGHLLAAGGPEFKTDVKRMLKYLIHTLDQYDVTVKMNKEATAENVIAAGFENVCLAAGSRSFVPPIPGVDNEIVKVADDAITGEPLTGNVVVVGAGLVGCEAALHAAKTASHVEVIEMLPKILAQADHLFNLDQWLHDEMDKFAQNGNNITCSAKVTKINPDSVEFEVNGETKKVAADHVVVASGYRANNQLEDELWGKVDNIRTVGDAVAPRKIITAVEEAFHFVRTIR